MELYEALRSGTSAEELETAFRTELIKAQERITKEQQELENKEAEAAYLEDSRAELAESLYDYIVALLGEENIDTTIDDIEDELLKIEKEVTSLCKVSKRLEESFNKLKRQSKNSTDDDIINRFLKSL